MVKLIRHTSIKKNVRFFCDNTSIHGLNFLTMKNISLFERIIWTLFNLAVVIATIFFISYLWEGYLRAPTVVTLESSNYPIANIKYPAISICNLNKISRQRAYEYAENLSKNHWFEKDNISVLLENIRLFGSLYDFDTYGQDRLTEFQAKLSKSGQTDLEVDSYDHTKRLIMLSTPCADILQKCVWGGKNYPCEELFLTRMTFEGPCCVFNYIRPSLRESIWNNSQKIPNISEVPQGPGQENGLEVTLNNKLDDYFHTSLESVGFNIHIFYPDDYPDILSGSLTEVVVNAGMRALINFDVDVIKSSPELSALPIYLRKCKFEIDDTTIFGGYRQSDCFVECKILSMQSLCNCIPFTLPVTPEASGKSSFCTLSDIACLNKHKDKWARYYPQDTDVTQLQEEQYDSLMCPKCLPPCNTIKYNVHTNFAPLPSTWKNNITVINIYPNRAFCNLYKVDLTLTWFEILSSFGGVLSLLMGLSVISVIEIFTLLYRIICYHIYVFCNK